MATKTETIRTRVDAELKAQTEDVLGKLGLSTSEAVRLFFAEVVLRKGLPFDVAIPNAVTRQAMDTLDVGRDVNRYDDFDNFRKAMLED